MFTNIYVYTENVQKINEFILCNVVTVDGADINCHGKYVLYVFIRKNNHCYEFVG